MQARVHLECGSKGGGNGGGGNNGAGSKGGAGNGGGKGVGNNEGKGSADAKQSGLFGTVHILRAWQCDCAQL